jgi:hypothetical protein
MQLCSCKRWSEVGGNLAEEKKLLSLAWSEVRGGLVVKDERLMAALVESFGCWSRCGRKKKLVCRGERKVHGGSWWSVGGFVGFLWWSWWWRSWLWLWLVAGTAGREREKKTAETGAEGLVFGRLWTPFSSCSGHEMHPYLLEAEEGHFFFNGAKLWPLVWLGSILTVGSKCPS